MTRGDYVLAYYAKGFHYVARVLATFHESALATSIWGTNENTGNTWEYMYFLTKPVKITASVNWVANLLNLNESSLMYQGFNRIGGRNRETILNTCGSVQDFVNLLIVYEGDGPLVRAPGCSNTCGAITFSDAILYHNMIFNYKFVI
jgi:hypothetical protein